jgi:hypothetical protein
MTENQKKQFRQRFSKHRYPVKTFRGDPMRPPYTLYSLWDYRTYLAAANELDELVDQWPYNRQRTVALLAVRANFYENGATHWAEQLVWGEDQENIHALMLRERQRVRRYDPILETQYTQNYALAQAALLESQRRKQGPATGKLRRLAQRSQPKRLYGLAKRIPRKAISLTLNAQLYVLFLAAQSSRYHL